MLTEVCQYLAKCIARDGEGATILMEVQVSGAVDDVSARKIARTIAGSSLVKSAIFGRDPNWGRIAAAAGRAGVAFDQNDLKIFLGDIHLMEAGQPLAFDRAAASQYLKDRAAGEYLTDDTVLISVSVGDGSGVGTAWGCDLSYDYVKINAEYTT
jgi:glutamate N-acetyltransferase/amino-acid N-acetyltransferase